jgi:hypothetical protein
MKTANLTKIKKNFKNGKSLPAQKHPMRQKRRFLRDIY